MRSQKGFTLAELLIVVAIILVLVAIAIPVFTGATQKAEEATCAANRTSL
ncbi:MAG: prepilin-type N-terminal cleavage/methylation domain-containing protein, partial [Raoultibacter sp.]